MALTPLTDWMALLRDDQLLSELSIPGTHDTGAHTGHPVSICQTMNVRGQLDAGIRFLDMRCRHLQDKFWIFHGPDDQDLEFSTGVRDVCLGFLHDHPKECIIMSIKEEPPEKGAPPDGCTRSFEATCSNMLNYGSDQCYSAETVPRLGDVRGKVVLFRRFDAKLLPTGIPASTWPDSKSFTIDGPPTLQIQDEYSISGAGALASKWTKVQVHLTKAAAAVDGAWYLNFLSASGGISPPMPHAFAVGDGTVDGENHRLLQYIQGAPIRIGTVLLDFPEFPENLLQSIVALNKR
jgi:1-phosphatidylinositol phosphodiesterase